MSENSNLEPLKEPSPKGKNVFVTMKGANSAYGISLKVLKASKNLGCPAFRKDNKLAYNEFVEWYEANKGLVNSYMENSAEEIKRQNLIKDGVLKDLEIAELKNELVKKSEVKDFIKKVGIAQCSLLSDKLKKEYLPKMEGKGLPDMLSLADLFIKEFIDKMNLPIDEWK